MKHAETLTVVATDYETYLVVYRCEDTAGRSAAPALCLPHAVHVSVLARHPLDDSTAPDIRKALHRICVPEDTLANLELSEGGKSLLAVFTHEELKKYRGSPV